MLKVISLLKRKEDMSFQEFKKQTRDEIIAAHNTPPRLVGIITSGQLGGGNELISQVHQFNETEILPKIELLEAFFDNIGIDLSLKAVDSTSFKDDAELIAGLIEIGVITVDEARNMLGWQKNLKPMKQPEIQNQDVKQIGFDNENSSTDIE